MNCVIEVEQRRYLVVINSFVKKKKNLFNLKKINYYLSLFRKKTNQIDLLWTTKDVQI